MSEPDLSWLDDAPPHSDADMPGQSKKTNGHANGHAHIPAIALPETYPLIWYGDITEPSHCEQLVEGTLIENTFGVIYGESNSGKTFFIMDLALAISQGIAWRGKYTRKGLVIYVAGEGANSVKNRVVAYRKTRPYVSGSSPFAILPTVVDFMAEECVEKLSVTIAEAVRKAGEPAALVVVDTLARAMPGGEENATRDMGIVVKAADAIRAATKACVMFVHHSGKDASKGARGSNSLRAATDTEILVEGTTGPRTVTITKQRDLDTGQKMVFELDVVEIGTDPRNETPITSCVVKHSDESVLPMIRPEVRGRAQKTMVAALREREKSDPRRMWTITEFRRLGKELGMSKSSSITVVDWLLSSGLTMPSVGGHLFTDGN